VVGWKGKKKQRGSVVSAMGGPLLMCGRNEVSWRREFGRKFISTKSVKGRLKLSGENKKERKKKTRHFQKF